VCQSEWPRSTQRRAATASAFITLHLRPLGRRADARIAKALPGGGHRDGAPGRGHERLRLIEWRSASTTPARSTSASSLAPIHGRYSPSIHPADFVATVDNALWPLEPARLTTTRAHAERRRQTDDEVVTHQIRKILGISATVVRDTVSEHGHAIERTLDFDAQDKHGNVWYLGGDRYRQEYYPPGEALDEAHVLGYRGSARSSRRWSRATTRRHARYTHHTKH
jgi:hypothetical protein